MAWIADAFVLLGLVVVTVGVYGVVRLPDVFTQLHAASKAAFLGVLSLLAAAAVAGDGDTVARAVLVAVVLVLTTPVGAHVIAQAALRRGEAADEVPAPPEMGARPDTAARP